jgi:uncharacterized protein YgbK (DUF1537 family)
MLFLGPPTAAQLDAAGPLDCIGIAGAARAMSPDEMAVELEPVGAFFARSGIPVIHYKTCSTFDSAPGTGSIGAAVRLLGRHIANPFRPIVGGQPSLGRYCLFANLFAAAEPGGPVHRLDRHPTMSRHPVTPMHEADLRLHLAGQGLARIASIDWTSYGLPADQLDARLDRVLADRPDAVLFDVSRADDLARIGRLISGRAVRQKLLAIGPSSVVQALTTGWRPGPAPEIALPQRIAPAGGPVFILAGSLSPVTARQIGCAPSYDRVELDVQRLARQDAEYLAGLLKHVTRVLHGGRSVLAHTARLEQTGRQATAAATGEFLVRLLGEARLGRIGIAGGDTSSHALKALAPWGLSYVGSLSAGVAVCRTHAAEPRLDGIEVMLKGGQMGPPDLFERLLHGA